MAYGRIQPQGPRCNFIPYQGYKIKLPLPSLLLYKALMSARVGGELFVYFIGLVQTLGLQEHGCLLKAPLCLVEFLIHNYCIEFVGLIN